MKKNVLLCKIIFLFLFLVIQKQTVYCAKKFVIKNPGFENVIKFNYWDKIGSDSSISRSSKIKRSGVYSCFFDDPTENYERRGIITSEISEAVGGEMYEVGAWFYLAYKSGLVTDSQIRLRIIWYDSNNVIISTSTSSDLTVTEFNTWELLTFTSSAPINAVGAKISISVKETDDNNNDIYVDDVLAEEIPLQSETTKTVEVLKPNPFIPHSGEETRIAYNIPVSATEAVLFNKSIKIFNMSGKEIITLMDNSTNFFTGVKMDDNVGTISWTGTDKYGSIVPTGVYIVYFDAYNPVTGKRFSGKDIVVVGRKF